MHDKRGGPSLAAKPILTGERVTLRPVTVDDAPGLVELLNDREVRRLTGTHSSRSGDLVTAQEWYRTRADHDDRIDWAIIDRNTGRYVGEAVLNDLDPENWSCSFRIALSAAANFGHGYGTEATRLAVGHAFDTGLHRVSLEVYDFNPRARHVYEKVGFVHEGTLRQALRWDGDWIDGHVMAILSEDWADNASVA